MRSIVKTLLAVSLASVSAMANAADYLTYAFHFSGYGITNQYSTNGFLAAHGEGATSGYITYYLPTSFAGAASAGYTCLPYTPPCNAPAYQSLKATFQNNVFELSDSYSPAGPAGDYRNDDLKVYINPGVPGPTIAVDPARSTAFLASGYSSPTGYGFTSNLGGVIDGLTITEGFGTAPIGFVSAPFVFASDLSSLPEPATYMLWIIGVGALGFVRRQHAGSKMRLRAALAGLGAA